MCGVMEGKGRASMHLGGGGRVWWVVVWWGMAYWGGGGSGSVWWDGVGQQPDSGRIRQGHGCCWGCGREGHSGSAVHPVAAQHVHCSCRWWLCCAVQCCAPLYDSSKQRFSATCAKPPCASPLGHLVAGQHLAVQQLSGLGLGALLWQAAGRMGGWVGVRGWLHPALCRQYTGMLVRAWPPSAAGATCLHAVCVCVCGGGLHRLLCASCTCCCWTERDCCAQVCCMCSVLV